MGEGETYPQSPCFPFGWRDPDFVGLFSTCWCSCSPVRAADSGRLPSSSDFVLRFGKSGILVYPVAIRLLSDLSSDRQSGEGVRGGPQILNLMGPAELIFFCLLRRTFLRSAHSPLLYPSRLLEDGTAAGSPLLMSP